MIPLIAAAVVVSMPNTICNPIEAPPILPILNANPPNPIRNATTYPSPGKILLAISCPLIRDTLIIVQTFNCAIIEKITETAIANPKSALYSAVKAAVCNINPGPIEDVAIKNAAPNRTEIFLLFVNGFI